MEAQFTEMTIACCYSDGKHPCRGRPTEVHTAPRAGKAHRFKQVTASVPPLFNTGCQTPCRALLKRLRNRYSLIRLC